MNPVIESVTERIRKRSEATRRGYLEQIQASIADGPSRSGLSCSNLAHGMAACAGPEKRLLSGDTEPNIGIVSAYNDMLSAHQPFASYPDLIKETAAAEGALAQFAGGVPAMCDGITQGQDGMDLSLFSRDVIALSTAIALSHNMFDAVLCLGICDKIVPGLLIGALKFGHLPMAFVPAGPMTSGLPNQEKARIREEFASGLVGRSELLAAESASYHSPGTCTFYGTANSNQMLMEFMGLQLPGGSFVNPDTELREHLTREAVRRILGLTRSGETYTPLGHVVDEKAIVNAVVGLLATGGSTNHTLHLVAIANAAGILIDWSDFADLSAVVPLMAKVYPNGMADVNQFHSAGGLGFLMTELLDVGLLHADVNTIMGPGLEAFCREPTLACGKLEWSPARRESLNRNILRPHSEPFDSEGGIRLVEGNLGRAIVKVSAVAEKHRRIKAPARVFESQRAFVEAFDNSELEQDFVAVLPCQGPGANGMPELHQLSPYLGVLMNRGIKLALLTDGRMSGASGKFLAAIQVTPEAQRGGIIGKLMDGDMIEIDAQRGVLAVDAPSEVASRESPAVEPNTHQTGVGRELFAVFRAGVGGAEVGASIFPRT